MLTRCTSVPAGNAQVPAILRHVFQYIALLNAPAGVTRALYDDNAALRELAFNYRNKPDAFSYTSGIAHMMHSYPTRHVLQVAGGVPLKFDEKVIRQELMALTPEGLMCMWASQAHDAAGMQTERWCGTLSEVLIRYVACLCGACFSSC
jgi:secreted Zn-dependent insulinase-like peptidase